MSKFSSWPFTACLFTGLAAVAQPEWPDELGDEMFHLSREVVTPHTDWAPRRPGGPLRMVVVIGRLAGRQVVELAQRLDVDYQEVLVGSQWHRPPTLEAAFVYRKAYGVSREDVLRRIDEKLAGRYEVLVLGPYAGWDLYPPEVQRKFLDHCERGRALLVHAAPDALRQALAERGAEPADAAEVNDLLASFRPVGDDPYPVELYRLGRGLVCVAPEWPPHGGADRFHDERGYARAARLLTALAGRRPALRIQAVIGPAGPVSVGEGELQLTLANRIDRTMAATLAIAARDTAYRLQKEWTQAVTLAAGETVVTVPIPKDLKRGRTLFEFRLLADGPGSGPSPIAHRPSPIGGFTHDWGWAEVKLQRRVGLAELTLAADHARPGEAVTALAVLDGEPGGEARLEFTLRDLFGRVVDQVMVDAPPHGGSRAASLRVEERPVAILHWVNVRLRVGDVVVDEAEVEFPVTDNSQPTLAFLGWQTGGVGWPAAGRELYRRGMGFVANCFNWARSAAACNMRAVPYSTSFHGTTVDQLFDEEFIRKQLNHAREQARDTVRYGTMAHSLGDENYLNISEEGRFSSSPVVMEQFRAYLQEEYGTLDALNAQWDTAFTDWDEIRFATEAELLGSEGGKGKEGEGREPEGSEIRNPKSEIPDNPSPWFDYRFFISRRFIGVHRQAAAAIREVHPGIAVGPDGTEHFSSYDGWDWYELASGGDMLGLYLYPRYPLKILNVYGARSFAPPGAVRGWWCNDSDRDSAEYTAWYTLFQGFNSVWWWHVSNVGSTESGLAPDYRPTPMFRRISDHVLEMQRGIADLLLRAERPTDGIAVHYSQANWHASTLSGAIGNHVNNLGGRVADWNPPERQGHYAAALLAWFTLLQDWGLQADLIARQQIEAGELATGRYRVLILPFVEALSDEEVAQIRQFVANGGYLIADYHVGLRDGHGKRRAQGALDDLFGVERTGDTLRKGLSATITDERFPGQLQDLIVDVDVRPTTAQAHGTAEGGGPVLFTREEGQGHTLLLNFSLYAYHDHRRESRETLERELFANLLEQHLDLSQRLRRTDGWPVSATEVVRFLDGPVEYRAIVRDYRVLDRTPQPVVLPFGRPGHLYDVRAQRYLGYADRIEATLEYGQPKVYACLPYRVDYFGFQPTAIECRPGDTVRLALHVRSRDTGQIRRHTALVEVLDPDGRAVDHYRRVVVLEEGRGELFWRPALNDRPGEWTLRATETVSGARATATVRVKPAEE